MHICANLPQKQRRGKLSPQEELTMPDRRPTGSSKIMLDLPRLCAHLPPCIPHAVEAHSVKGRTVTAARNERKTTGSGPSLRQGPTRTGGFRRKTTQKVTSHLITIPIAGEPACVSRNIRSASNSSHHIMTGATRSLKAIMASLARPCALRRDFPICRAAEQSAGGQIT